MDDRWRGHAPGLTPWCWTQPFGEGKVDGIDAGGILVHLLLYRHWVVAFHIL